ncbi:PREDICTED: pyridoxal-dependent decarboxylase domain-containing protein 1-like [Priapulus caudatus]|uniref:Pyridoxal-dependent decarboxylase domain-containing protein 1-like n=1 Tax=Priapulus caudatus TaxID=37621 RepID=A0ABM1ENL9_PRICU|nr:PREDICTED: pyridoxal-dependent decarboxylase domain-containing protein 1-like [Priapulus caudatus]
MWSCCPPAESTDFCIHLDTDTEDLISVVFDAGREVEESSKFVEQMAEVVKKGIEAVNKDLEQENAEKIMQEGVLRYVPLVGSLVNWWSPPPKEVGIRGRTFDLTSGMIESTENTYKYHMQIQHGPAPIQKLQILAQPHGNDGSSQQTTGSEKSSSSPDHASKTPTTTTSSDDSGDGEASIEPVASTSGSNQDYAECEPDIAS